MGHKSLCATLLLGTLLAGAPVFANDTPDNESFVKVRADAVTAIDRAAEVRGEWRDSRKLLEQADKAAAEGDFAKALKLASTAKQEGELGHAQAVAQRGAGDNIR